MHACMYVCSIHACNYHKPNFIPIEMKFKKSPIKTMVNKQNRLLENMAVCRIDRYCDVERKLLIIEKKDT